MGAIEDRLAEMGLELPGVVKPMAKYVPARRAGNLVYTAGQGPFKDGELLYLGQVGADLTEEEGQESARICALNCLGAIKALIGSLDLIDHVVQLRGYVNSAPGFDRQPEVINGASELVVALFGERGAHARSALGTSALPRGISVELEMVVQVREGEDGE